MMKTRLACPECGVRLKADKVPAQGTNVRCPQCQSRFQVPGVGTVELPASEAARLGVSSPGQTMSVTQAEGQRVQVTHWVDRKTLLVGAAMLILGVVVAVPVAYRLAGPVERSAARAEQIGIAAVASSESTQLKSGSGISTMKPGVVVGEGNTSTAPITQIPVPAVVAKNSGEVSESRTVQTDEKAEASDSKAPNESPPSTLLVRAYNPLESDGFPPASRLDQIQEWAAVDVGGPLIHAAVPQFSSDGRILVVGLEGGGSRVVVCDVMSRKVLLTLGQGARLEQLSADGKNLLAFDREYGVWDISTLNRRPGNVGYVRCSAFSPDGRSLAIGTELPRDRVGAAVRLFDLDTLSERAILERLGLSIDSGIRSVAFSPDGATLAALAYPRRELLLLNGATLKIRDTIQLRDDFLTLAFSPTGSTLFLQSGGSGGEIWDIATMKRVWSGHKAGQQSPFGTFLGFIDQATICTRDGQLVDAATGQSRKRLDTKRGYTNTRILAFSADGATCVFDDPTSDNLQATVWDLRNDVPLVQLTGHRSPVIAAAYSGNSQFLATVDKANAIRIWQLGPILRGLASTQIADAAEREPKKARPVVEKESVREQKPESLEPQRARVLPSKAGEPVVLKAGEPVVLADRGSEIVSLVFSPDDGKLASIDGYGVTKLWDMKFDSVGNLSAPRARYGTSRVALGGKYLSISSDGQIVVSGGAAGVHVYDLASGQQKTTFGVDSQYVRPLVVSPDGDKVAIASFSGVTIWDLETYDSLGVLDLSGGSFGPAAFSPAGDMLAVSSTKGLHLYDIGRQKELPVLSGLPQGAGKLDFSADGQVLVCSLGRSLYFWRIDRNVPRVQLVRQETEPTDQFLFSPDRKTLAVVMKQKLILRDADSGNVRSSFPVPFACDFSPDKKTVAATDRNSVSLWELASGRRIDTLETGARVTEVAFSHNGKLLATGDANGAIKLWKMSSQAVKRREPWATFTTKTAPKSAKEGVNPTVVKAEFSPDAKMLVTWDSYGSVNVWDVEGRKLIHAFSEPLGLTTPSVISPDGRRLLTLDGAGHPLMYDLSTGKVQSGGSGKPKGLPPGYTAFQVSFDKKLIAAAIMTSTGEGAVLLLDPISMKPRGKVSLPADSTGLLKLAISRDGKWLAGIGGKGVVKLWDVRDANNIREQLTTAMESGVERSRASSWAGVFEFLDDSLTLVTSGRDNAHLWDAETGVLKETINVGKPPTTGTVVSTAFSRDGKSFITVNCFGEVFLRETATGKVLEILGDVSSELDAGAGRGIFEQKYAGANIALSRDGTLLAVGLPDRSVKIWKLRAE